MVPIATIVRTFFSRLLAAVLIFVAMPFVLVMMLLPEKIRYRATPLFWCLHVGYKGLIWIMRLFTGAVTYCKSNQNIRGGYKGPVIFVANHQSALDVPLLGVLALGRPHIWIARQELMKWKLLRWLLPRLSIVIDVTSRQKSMSGLLRFMRLVQGRDIDIMLFPEGERHTDGRIHVFYGGFVMLARLLKRPVVPVCILGVGKVYPPDTFWVQRHPIKIVVGEPLEIHDQETDDAFKDRVRQWFVQCMEG